MKTKQLSCLLLITLVFGGVFGCTSPCGHIEDAGWHCNLKVTNLYRPGELIFVERNEKGEKVIVTLPQRAQRYVEDSRSATIADVTHQSDWTFSIGVAAGEFPGVSAVSDIEGKLKTAGFKEIEYKFSDTSIVSLKIDDETLPEDGADLIKQAQLIAQKYVDALTPSDMNGIKREIGNSRTVWLVMQVIDSNIVGELRSGGSVGTEAEATVQGIGLEAGLDTNTETTYSISTKEPQMIAMRVIPLVIQGELVGPNAGISVLIDDEAKLGGID